MTEEAARRKTGRHRLLLLVLGGATVGIVVLLLWKTGGSNHVNGPLADRMSSTAFPSVRQAVTESPGDISAREGIGVEGYITVDVFASAGGGSSPVADAPVWIYTPTPGGVSSPAAMTDKEGRCLLPVSSPDSDGHVRVYAESESRRLAAVRPVAAKAGETVRIDLVGTYRIRGLVRGADDLDAAQVRAFSNNWPEAPAARILPVGADGSFDVPGIVHFVTLTAIHPEHASSRTEILYAYNGSIQKAAEEGLVLDLGRQVNRAEVALKVFAGRSAPSGALVASLLENGERQINDYTDEDGVANIAFFPGEGLQVVIPPIPRQFGSGWLTLRWAETLVSPFPKEIDLPAAAGPLRFRVRTVEGEPAVGLELEIVVGRGLSALRSAIRTNEEGIAIVPNPLPPGDARLVSWGKELWSGRLTVEPHSLQEVILHGLKVVAVVPQGPDGQTAALLQGMVEVVVGQRTVFHGPLDECIAILIPANELLGTVAAVWGPGYDASGIRPNSEDSILVRAPPESGALRVIGGADGGYLILSDAAAPDRTIAQIPAVDGKTIAGLATGRYVWRLEVGSPWNATGYVEVAPGQVTDVRVDHSMLSRR